MASGNIEHQGIQTRWYSNETWKDKLTTSSFNIFYYDQTGGETTFDIPAQRLFVVTIIYAPSRGLAFSFPWQLSGGTDLMVNKLHDAWQGWQKIN